MLKCLLSAISTKPSGFSNFLINTADRVIRVYDSKEILTYGKDGEPEPIQKLQDLVNKYSFNLLELQKVGC